MTPQVVVVGAGLAGLSAAVDLAGRGLQVELVEAAAQAGGRCRTYLDPVLRMPIDNGAHLILSGNRETFVYLRRIGAEDRLRGAPAASFAFCDVRDGRRWTVRPNAGPLAWWVLAPQRRPPGTRARDYLAVLRLLRARNGRRLDQVIRCEGPLWERLMRPLLLAALNTDPEGASAGLAAAVLRESLARGEAACRPRIADPSLAAAFIDPALAFLERRGAVVRFGRRLRGLTVEGDRVRTLELADGSRPVRDDQSVILATPPWVTGSLLPGVAAPDRFEAVVNAHFRRPPPPDGPAMVGVIGGAAEWIFAFPDRLSVTVSAAERLVEADRETLARTFWRDVRVVYGLGPELPEWQIVKERRATFAALPDQAARRAGARTPLKNLLLAGDWTDTGLPATIEGAVRSGHKAAGLAADYLRAA